MINKKSKLIVSIIFLIVIITISIKSFAVNKIYTKELSKGDNLVFTKPDGTKIDCVVGAVVDYSQEYKGNVSFIVSDTWNAQGANNLTFDLNNMKILNNGQYVPKKG